MKKYIIIFVLLIACMTVQAAPAKHGVVRNVVLTDGSTIEVTLCGDEYAHWWESADGRKIDIDDNGMARIMAGEDFSFRREYATAKRAKANGNRTNRMNKAKQNAGNVTFSGSKKGLVILVEFSNLEMKAGSTQTAFDNMFNQEGYSKNNHIGSVHDYFYDQSYGQFDLSFDVVGPVTVANTYSYYGANNSDGDDKYPATMVVEACQLVDELVDFADYDWDGDGYVDQVYVVYAGYGENSGAPRNTIWPHEWTLSEASDYGDGDGPQEFDGVMVDTYAVSCELEGVSGSTMAGIGVACHEFSHCLGYPDFYDVDSSGGVGMAIWDLLDSGSYNGPSGNGEVPAGFTAYERMVAGWLEPVELSPGMDVDGMATIGEEAEAYIVYNDGNRNEYYLLENRDNSRWFSYWGANKASKSGMLITHVDYNRNAWINNTVNDSKSHQRMTFIPANNKFGSGSSTYAGQLYPTANNNELTNTSTPAAKTFNKNIDGQKLMNKPIVNIVKNADKTISFSCVEMENEEDPDDPENPNPDINPTGDVVFYESFDSCEGTGGNDDKWSGNIASSVFNSDIDGWTAEKKYGANKCARFGTGKEIGVVVSPSFVLDGDALLTFKAGAWGTDGNVLAVQLNEQYLGNYTINNGSWSELSIPLNYNGSCTLKFLPDKRFFLDEVKIVKLQATDIMNVDAEAASEIYNIQGQRVVQATGNLKRGIYIRDGRKYIVK